METGKGITAQEKGAIEEEHLWLKRGGDTRRIQLRSRRLDGDDLQTLVGSGKLEAPSPTDLKGESAYAQSADVEKKLGQRLREI